MKKPTRLSSLQWAVFEAVTGGFPDMARQKAHRLTKEEKEEVGTFMAKFGLDVPWETEDALGNPGEVETGAE